MSGNIYTGQFHRGELHGQGLLRTPAGEQYEGDFVEGRKEGKCTMEIGSVPISEVSLFWWLKSIHM